mmetsp:Transcript_8671/g.19075  ORF Transcript_8671/g.19075 Transcript_8671/m.19075 type:complete len:242 (+) Transcript_8671:248-973(+)
MSSMVSFRRYCFKPSWSLASSMLRSLSLMPRILAFSWSARLATCSVPPCSAPPSELLFLLSLLAVAPLPAARPAPASAPSKPSPSQRPPAPEGGAGAGSTRSYRLEESRSLISSDAGSPPPRSREGSSAGDTAPASSASGSSASSSSSSSSPTRPSSIIAAMSSTGRFAIISTIFSVSMEQIISRSVSGSVEASFFTSSFLLEMPMTSCTSSRFPQPKARDSSISSSSSSTGQSGGGFLQK